MQTDLIRRALDKSGYDHESATPESLKSCFEDYVDAGVWGDLELQDIEGLSISDMSRALINIRW